MLMSGDGRKPVLALTHCSPSCTLQVHKELPTKLWIQEYSALLLQHEHPQGNCNDIAVVRQDGTLARPSNRAVDELPTQ